MPRLKAVRAEIGTTGQFEEVSITDHPAGDIAEAVEREHMCSDSHCDIRYANEEGYPYVAAYLLAGATETPLLDAVCRAHGFNPSSTYDNVPGWDEWVEWFKANDRECGSCGSFNFDPDYDYCGNCLAPLESREV